jgi:hypothetical protein
MTRICIISDSSVNAIKTGWPLVESQYPDCELTYFAAGRDNMRTLEVSDGRLISNDPHCAQRMRRSSDGLDAITNDYDWYLIFALGFNLNFIVHLCMMYRIECEGTDERVPVSDACFQGAVEGELYDSMAMATVFKLRQITSAPIAMVAAPMRCRLQASSGMRRMRETGVDQSIKNLANGVAQHLARKHDFRLFLQPEHTLSTPLTTDSMYSRVPGATDGHMNAAFGKEVWNAVLDRFPAGIM